MAILTRRTRVCVLLLALVFIAAQFHYCGDLGAGDYGAHFCPICSTTLSVVRAPIPVIGAVPVIVRLEVHQTHMAISAEIAESLSPRAPPAV